MRAWTFAASLTLLLSGCATDALQTAPARPDQPWKPHVAANGVLLPGRATPEKMSPGLRLPAGFELPANQELRPRPPASEVRPDHDYDLLELIDLAETSNPTTRRAWDAARDAALAVGIARSSYLPTLTASVVGGYTSSNQNGNSVRINGAGSLESQINAGLKAISDHLNNRSGGQSGTGEVQTLGIQWLLFDFGNREARINAAQQAQIASNVLFNGAHQKVIYEVSIAFYRHAAAVARLALERAALADSRKVEAAAEERLRHGHGTVQDAAQARQMTAQGALRVVQGEGEIEDSNLAFMTTAGLSPLTHLRTASVSGRPLNDGDLRLTDRLVRQAVARRPDVLAAYANVRAATANVQAAHSDFLPKVFVTGNVAYSTGNLALSSVPGIGQNSSPTLNLSSDRFSSLILGGITVPVFDGGLRSALLKQAENRADAAHATLRQTIDESVRQVVAAQNALHTAYTAFATASALVAASETSFQAAWSAYRSGAGSVTQATIAANGLAQARISQSDAYHAALAAAASLAFATGAIGTTGDVSARFNDMEE
ncbi:TolC family protein [Brytella acorum]|uniref:TolC family protein n=1 Tax=Brytella acorum TaxID=2959299 RepID=A0AA35UQX2_9PROT|nr:TolC family protein [Brytella acorum]CAI9120484.1 TolC family protein [Brytella acorum]